MTVYSHNDINIKGRTFQGTAKCIQVRTVYKENVYLFHLRLSNQSFNNTCPIKVPGLITAASVCLFPHKPVFHEMKSSYGTGPSKSAGSAIII